MMDRLRPRLIDQAVGRGKKEKKRKKANIRADDMVRHVRPRIDYSTDWVYIPTR